MGYTKIIQSGTLLEVYRYEKNLPIRRSVPRQNTDRKRNNRITKRSFDSVRRAARAFRRIVRSNLVGNDVPSLFTFTMYQKLSYSTSVRIFTRFAARLRRVCGGEFRYIAVPEFQKRGAVHWHVLIWGLSAYAKNERATRRISRLWQRGFVDCVITDGHPKLSGYLAKYMSKTMSDIRLGGKKAYYASRNILRPMSNSSGNGSIQAVFDEHIIPSVDNLLTTHEFSTQWLGRAIYQSYRLEHYACKTDSSHDSQS